MKYLYFSLFIFIFFVSGCQTMPAVPIPGEIETKTNNIYIEYMNIADSYMELNKYDKAVEFYTYALKNKSIFWTCYYKLGRAYVFAKKYKEARKIYNRLLKRDKNNTDLQISIAYLYAMEGNLEAAINIYEYLCGKEPNNADILVNYINVLVADERMDYAKTKFNELKEHFPDNSNIENLSKVINTEVDENSDSQKDSENKEK